MARDYKSVLFNDIANSDAQQSLTSKNAHWIGLVASIAILGSIFFVGTDNAKATRSEAVALDPAPFITATLPESTQTTTVATTEALTNKPLSTRINLPLAIPGSTAAAAFTPAVDSTEQQSKPWRTATVKSGDSLALIFARQGLSPQQLDRMMRADKATAAFKRLMPGQQFKFHIDNGELQSLVYKIDSLNTLKVTRNNQDEFVVASDTREMETRVTNTSAVIDSSLFLAGQAAGMSDNLIMELAGIFGWDVDFALDIRGGDHFTLVYEELYLDGKKQRDGNILAAEFVNRGKSYRALRYVDSSGRADYYSPDGHSMRKAFLRTPVDFTRISSRFGARFHPMLKKKKNHHGVDYAAPRGTPIKAAGDGKLAFVGRKGGYGKTVIIQHGGKYSTLYAHMSRIKPGSHRGKHVRQGEVIGYVGSTGRSTGPHLHYEFRVNGVHRNPLTVRLPDAAPISAKYKSDFLNKSRGLVALLDVLQRTTVALNDQNRNP
jgi:murein DD-endopeptidase MepM/ murein hydrolase activator NlpD